MRALLQRVAWARVVVESDAGEDEVVGEIAHGLLILLGVARGDTEQAAEELSERAAQYRMFGDERGRMNRSVEDAGGAVLVVSQFTLCADVEAGRRPSFTTAEAPERARELCERFIDALRARGLRVATGRFGAHMRVESCNDGPVTFVIDRRPPEPAR